MEKKLLELNNKHFENEDFQKKKEVECGFAASNLIQDSLKKDQGCNTLIR